MYYWIWFYLLKTLDIIQKNKLIEIYKSPKQIFNLNEQELSNLFFLNESNIMEMCNKSNDELIKRYEKYMKEKNILMVNITDKEYPKKLKNIYAPPITLFLKGNIELLNKNIVAVIGCRIASKYGISTTRNLAYKLASKNIVIVSGLARGIDKVAHEGALRARGGTIAVLGSGVDVVYPPENIDVYKNILDNNGLIISEYIVGTKATPENFPARNRIISGISDGVVVVEAKKKSGSMITVDFALEQGKNVYAVPGNICSINSEGTNELIKQGAKIVTSYEDILEDFQE